MKEENEITKEVKELLDSLEQHGQNARRQKELSDLIDHLERKTENGKQKTFHFPLSTFLLSAAAACLLIWLLTRPSFKDTPNFEEQPLVEEVETVDSVKTSHENNFFEEPSYKEDSLADEKPSSPPKTSTKKVKPLNNLSKRNRGEAVVEEPLLAEVVSMEPSDTMNIESNMIPSVEEENLSPLTSHLLPNGSLQRRVIRSLNLVCFECETENGERIMENFPPSTFHFPLEKDPNMKNGSLAFELKLH